MADSICFLVFFNLEMSLLFISKVNTFLRECEFMVAIQHFASQLDYINVMPFSHLLKTLVGGSFILLHVIVPGHSEFHKLFSLDILNLLQFKSFPVLHSTSLFCEFDLTQLLMILLTLDHFMIFLIVTKPFAIVFQYFQESHNFEVREAVHSCLWQHFSIFSS